MNSNDDIFIRIAKMEKNLEIIRQDLDKIKAIKKSLRQDLDKIYTIEEVIEFYTKKTRKM